jgi:hypothetical protein
MSNQQLLQHTDVQATEYFDCVEAMRFNQEVDQDDDILHDLVEFCEYFEQRPSLSPSQQYNVRTVMVPGLLAMLSYFESLLTVDNLALLKLIGKWVGHLRNLLAARKDLELQLKQDLEQARRKQLTSQDIQLIWSEKLKTRITALCVGEMLKDLTPARPLSDQTVARSRHAAAMMYRA